MSNDEGYFDQIVIGAGMAGLCCAGELVLRGQRPLLIAETKEVGAAFPVRWLNGNRFFLQHFLWQLGWDGGWWYRLSRALNIPVRLYPGMSFGATVKGSDRIVEIPVCSSAAGLTDVILEAFPFPIEGVEKRLEKVLEAALSIPHDELVGMQQVLLSEWLEHQGADEMVSWIMLSLGGAPHDLTVDTARERLSVFGGIGVLRAMFAGEGLLPIIYPDAREGLCIPIAREVERRGGAVWRGRKVQRVITDGGRVEGVVLEDGTQIEAPIVAIATGNPRIRALLNPLPAEIVDVLTYSSGLTLDIHNVFYQLSRPMLPERMAMALFDMATMGLSHWNWPITGVAPWTTPNREHQLVGSHIAYLPDQSAASGGPEAVYTRALALSDEIYPGFADAVLGSVAVTNQHGWMNQVSVGPRLPRTVGSVDGLWFVGDGSEPSRGIWTEAAASGGILGARAMVSGAGRASMSSRS